MAEAIVRGAVDAGVLAVGDVIVSDPSAERRGVFEAMGIEVIEDNEPVITGAQRVLLAVKPQVFAQLNETMQTIEDRLVVSIMAGISIDTIRQATGGRGRVIRVMPNTPLLVGKGASGIAPSAEASERDVAFVRALFGAAGLTEVVDEGLMDAVTAVSGSGPAYLFYLAEAMAEAGAKLGLPADQADRLARQTVLGASTLLNTSEESAAGLRRRVTSPGGTTQAAIEHLDASAVRQHIQDAIGRAEARGRELGG